jgi:hypothetical protein
MLIKDNGLRVDVFSTPSRSVLLFKVLTLEP